MGLRMKIFSILRVHWKTRVLGGEVHEKPIKRGGEGDRQYIGEGCLKRGGLDGLQQT